MVFPSIYLRPLGRLGGLYDLGLHSRHIIGVSYKVLAVGVERRVFILRVAPSVSVCSQEIV